jgi:hypothetical protein
VSIRKRFKVQENAQTLLAIVAAGAGCVLLVALTVSAVALLLAFLFWILSDLDRVWEKK